MFQESSDQGLGLRRNLVAPYLPSGFIWVNDEYWWMISWCSSTYICWSNFPMSQSHVKYSWPSAEKKPASGNLSQSNIQLPTLSINHRSKHQKSRICTILKSIANPSTSLCTHIPWLTPITRGKNMYNCSPRNTDWLIIKVVPSGEHQACNTRLTKIVLPNGVFFPHDDDSVKNHRKKHRQTASFTFL